MKKLDIHKRLSQMMKPIFERDKYPGFTVADLEDALDRVGHFDVTVDHFPIDGYRISIQVERYP